MPYRQPMAADADAVRISRFASLGNVAYRRLWWGGSFVFLAMQVQQIARAWLTYEITGSNAALGGVMLGFGVAGLIAIPVGGVLADRLDKRTIMTGCQLVNTLTAAAMAAVVLTGVVAYWMVIAAAVLGGAAISLLAPARMAMIAEVVDRDRLTNAVMLSTTSLHGTRVLGPAVAGTLIGVAWVGLGGVFVISSALSGVSIVLTVMLPSGKADRSPSGGPVADLLDAIRYVRARGDLVRVIVMSLVIIVLGFPFQVFLPVVVGDIFERDAGALGLMTTAAAVGAVVVSVMLADTPPGRLQRRQTMSAAALGVSLVAFALSPWFWGAVAVIAVTGAALAAFQSLNGSLAISLSAMEYHGRVQSLLMLSFSALGLATLPIGLVADSIGVRPTLAVLGAGVLVATLGGLAWQRRLRSARLPAL